MSVTRQRRRYFGRALKKLIKTKGNNCSLCSTEFQHNSRTFGGYDQHGNIALVGECCSERLHEVYTAGLYSCRNYDFLPAGEHSHGRGLGNAKVAHLLDLCQRAIAGADENVKDDMWQRGGVSPPPHALISVLPRPWKQDDRLWFERHSKRSHRARFPFPGEVEPQHADAPEGHRLLLLVRQIQPSQRIKLRFFINEQLLLVPDAEAVAHALFDIASRHEPMPRNREAMHALIEKYQELPEVM